MRKHLITAAVLASCAAATSAYAVDIGESTTVGGVAFFDFSNISLQQGQANGTSPSVNPSGTGFDVKRFYLTVDHKFDDVWSANLTTDAQYAASSSANAISSVTACSNGGTVNAAKTGCTGTGSAPTAFGTTSVITNANSGNVTELMIKKLYLTGKFSDAFVIHVGSYDNPWIPYVESLYGYRFVEKMAADRLGFGNTADWGLNASGAFGGSLLNYSFSVVDGGGYKNPTRTKKVDFEGRISSKPTDWLDVGVGFYTGHLGQITTSNDGFPTNTATRFDAAASAHFAGFKIGGEFLYAKNYKTVNSLTASVYGSSSIVNSATIAPISDYAEGFSVFTSYAFNPQWSVFARYDDINLSKDVAADLKDKYLNAGVDYKPYKAVDVSLVYKNEKVNNGSTSISGADANGSYTIGGVNGATNGKFSEVGVYVQYKF